LAQAAFCETFDGPSANPPSNGRAGQLNGVVWGTAESTGNQTSGGLSSTPGACGGPAVYYPANIQVCNGQMVDTIDDGDTVTSLAAYPRQPFDFAGRTGKIVFDLSNDSQGGHAAWPELWVTDQPVPDPWTFNGTWFALPRNGFGIPFDGCDTTCPDPNGIGVQDGTSVANYVASGLPAQEASDVIKSGPGQMNHYELDVSQNRIDVYGTNPFIPGQTVPPLRHLATYNANLSFSRGVVWIEDEHYSACKFNTQCVHSFRWDNVGFDGPVLPRDLGFDIPNPPGPDEEYQIAPNSSLALTIPAVGGIDKAAAALFEFNFNSEYSRIPLQVAVNGHDISIPWPFPYDPSSMQTIALPVPLADLVAGDNQVMFSAGANAWRVSNIDLILLGAGG
jgi:hypothetical protein